MSRVAAATEFVAVALLAISEEARLYMVFLAMSNEWNQDKRKKGLARGGGQQNQGLRIHPESRAVAAVCLKGRSSTR